MTGLADQNPTKRQCGHKFLLAATCPACAAELAESNPSKRRFVGWRVHTWAYPVVRFARRKPRSQFRQWLWDQTDAIKWRGAMRYWRKFNR